MHISYGIFFFSMYIYIYGMYVYIICVYIYFVLFFYNDFYFCFVCIVFIVGVLGIYGDVNHHFTTPRCERFLEQIRLDLVKRIRVAVMTSP